MLLAANLALLLLRLVIREAAAALLLPICCDWCGIVAVVNGDELERIDAAVVVVAVVIAGDDWRWFGRLCEVVGGANW